MLRLSEARINDALANNTLAELVEQRLIQYDNKALWKCFATLNEKPPQV
jgi:hypothetical protein